MIFVMKRAAMCAVGFAAVLAAGGARASEASALWRIGGDFGRVEGPVVARADGFSAEAYGCRVETKVVSNACGVVSRQSVVRNVGAAPIVLTDMLDAWTLSGDDSEVYTQSNTWQNESAGRWQNLEDVVEAACGGMRACDAATPMLAVWNRRTKRGRAFYALSDGSWILRATRRTEGGVRVEVGYNPRHLNWKLQPDEEARLPEVLSHEFSNRTDLDCHKLHAYWNARCPASEVSLAPIYNTWLCRFDRLELDFVLKQVARAKEIGFEYFVVDAGWFGPKARWWDVRGDWEESADGWLGGRLDEVSKAVRAAGMKFGFWIEAECASPNARVLKEHPDWFFKADDAVFLDFRKPSARDALLERVCSLVRRYGASFVKFDFNQTAARDPSGRVWTDYIAAYRRFVESVRARNPGIYLEGCAGGGFMMDLGWSRTYDGFWLTDNQSAYAGVRIAKDTMLRLPPRYMERWFTLLREEGLQPDYDGSTSRLLTTEDAQWSDYRTLSPMRVDAFTAGGPFCMSCNLLTFNGDDLAHFRKLIAETRQDAAFWKMAVGRILLNTPELTVLQYSDVALTDVRIVAVPSGRAASATVFPTVDSSRTYERDGRRCAGKDLMKDGLPVKIEKGACWLGRFRAR